jgi:hypothetical protein
MTKKRVVGLKIIIGLLHYWTGLPERNQRFYFLTVISDLKLICGDQED